jgi:hypothetical protein
MSVADGASSWCTHAFPACRHADGTISSSSVLDVRRMASEDSEEVSPGLLALHRLRDLNDLRHALTREVMARIDQLHALRELLEVTLLRRVHRMRPKERDDLSDQIRPPAHHIAIQVLAMVVVPLVREYLSHPEEALELVQTRCALRTLRHHKLVSHLIAGSVAAPASSATLADETDREATFSVYKTNNPAFLPQPFLLVFRTVRIVTAHHRSVRRVPDGYSGFPAYSRMQSMLLPAWWATIYLRTVIVTAAVYRGLASVLRVAPNTST